MRGFQYATSPSLGLAGSNLVPGASSSKARLGHEGHDHGAVARRRWRSAAAPRAEAASELFELVAAARGRRTDDLSRPLRDRRAGDRRGDHGRNSAGQRRSEARRRRHLSASGRLVERAGHYDLIFTVTKGDAADVLTATLDVPPAGAAAGQRPVQTTGSTGTEQLRERLARLDFGLAGAVDRGLHRRGGRRAVAGAAPARIGAARGAGCRPRAGHHRACA